MNEASKRYITAVGRELICPKAQKAAMLERLEGRIGDLLLEEPEAGYGDIVAAFGPPEVLAAELVADLDPQVVIREAARRKTLRVSLLAVAFGMLLCLTVYWCVKWTKAQKVIRGDFRVVTTIEPWELEDFEELWRSTPESAHDTDRDGE